MIVRFEQDEARLRELADKESTKALTDAERAEMARIEAKRKARGDEGRTFFGK